MGSGHGRLDTGKEEADGGENRGGRGGRDGIRILLETNIGIKANSLPFGSSVRNNQRERKEEKGKGKGVACKAENGE